jgi:hypothetical protein
MTNSKQNRISVQIPGLEAAKPVADPNLYAESVMNIIGSKALELLERQEDIGFQAYVRSAPTLPSNERILLGEN